MSITFKDIQFEIEDYYKIRVKYVFNLYIMINNFAGLKPLVTTKTIIANKFLNSIYDHNFFNKIIYKIHYKNIKKG